jgi:hypothetical protein
LYVNHKEPGSLYVYRSAVQEVKEVWANYQILVAEFRHFCANTADFAQECVKKRPIKNK